MTYFLICVWTACILLSFIGFGRLLLRLCRWPEPGFALAGCAGVGTVVALGGLLNLGRLIVPSVLLGLVGAGCVLALSLTSWRRIRFTPGLILLICLLSVPVLGNLLVDTRAFNLYDDLPAYLTLPVETLQLHSLPPDPFNERRITTSLGAPLFLQAVVLVMGDVRSLGAIDVSIGWILYAGVVLAIFRKLGLSGSVSLGLGALILIVPVYRINTTFVVLPAAMFCALFLVLMEPVETWRKAALLAVLTAGVSALKSNYLPPAVLICGLYLAGRWVFSKSERRTAALNAVLWFTLTGLLLWPWMLDQKRKEGTYLFPLLGRGYDASAYGYVPLPNGGHAGIGAAGPWVWITTAFYAGPYLAALAAVLLARKTDRKTHLFLPLTALLLGTAGSIAALAFSTGGESIGRYSLPFQIPALVIFCGFLLYWRRGGPLPAWWRVSAGLAGCYLLFLAVLFGVRHGQYRRFLEDARLLTPAPASWFSPSAERNRVRALQSSIPPGEAVLSRLFVSYPFDFQRNPIFVADYTGMAGPPPGMPVGEDPEAVREYLLQNHIRYLAYDYRRTMLPDDDPSTTVETVLRDQRRYGRHGWLYLQVKVTNSEQRNFESIGRNCRRVYDDGVAFVADLSKPNGR